MIHDPALLDRLSAFHTERFEGKVFRATRVGLDPRAESTSGGRWAPRGQTPVLYTSLVREGALAEIAWHWGQLTPLPSKPVVVHRLAVSIERKLRLIRTDLDELGVETALYETRNYHRTREIGAAVAFLGCDGLIVPCARWNCENLVIFAENHSLTSRLDVLSSEEVDWRRWAQDSGLLRSDDVS